ncbi:exocyst complex component EXO84B-like isoform X3 [Cicer arietinum]|nr:exocyst complex component EXO84B-like isoform X2 [Cicer arietinum]
MLVKDLKDRIYPKILSINSTIGEESIDITPSPPSKFEAHVNDVSEKLDILVSENKIDEALQLLESEYEHSHDDNEILLYNTVISEKKSMLIQQLTQMVENKRLVGSELHSALASLYRLGDTQFAIHLLLRYCHLCIVTGKNNLQWSSSSLNEIYIRKLARFVFSMISQAAKSFVMLCGETSPYASELLLWSYEETMSFIACFENFVKCISTVSVGLSSAIKSVKFAVMYCSLLENQKLVLKPYLVKHLCPCMEEVLNTHINHFKKVIPIFSVSDPWILEKYLVSGVFGEAGSSTEQPDFCLLTSSGRKVLTLLQAITEDVSPLVALEMGNLVISGLKNLFNEYIIILERALTYETSAMEQDSPRIKFAESLTQQVSILANLSTLVQFLSTMVKGIFSSRSTSHIDSQVVENHSVVNQHRELDDFLLFIEEDSNNKLRNVFCNQLILRVLSTCSSHEIFPATHYNHQFDDNTIHNPMPSAIFQALFLELRKIEKLEEENVFEGNWLMELLREVMVSMFIWLSKNKEMNATTEEKVSLQTDEAKQFILDVQFLVEMGMYGGYFSTDPLLLLNLMKSTFNSAGLDPFKDVDSDDWAIDVASETIQKLLEIEKTSLHPNESIVAMKEELHEHQNYECNFSEVDDINCLEDKVDLEEHGSEIAVVAETDSTTFSIGEGSLADRDYVDIDNVNMRQHSMSYMQLENTDFEKTTDVGNDELTPIHFLGEVVQNSDQTESKSEE